MPLNLLSPVNLGRPLYGHNFLFHSIFIISIFVFPAKGQAPVNYKLFGQFPSVRIPIPEQYHIQPIPKPEDLSAGIIYFNTRPNFPTDAGEDQNRRLLQQNNVQPDFQGPTRVMQQAQLERELMEAEFYRKAREKDAATMPYQRAFKDLSRLDPDHFSIIRAQYDIENAYLDGALPYDLFVRAVRSRAILVKQILRRVGIKPNNNLALNYGIQQLYQHPNLFYDSIHKTTVTIAPFSYQFDDYTGEKNYENIFTEKLMRTGKGQCLSMPRLYLMIAEQLGAEAWLSLAPQHSFIQFKDGKGRLMNFETTNGNIVSGSWLAASGYINGKAVRNNIYLDTLSQRQLYARCLADLLLSYLHKFGYDDFSSNVTHRILQIDPQNMTALIVEANLKREIAWREILAVGRPKEVDLPQFPSAYKAYLDMQTAMDKVDNLGYQEMPSEAYQAWLQSIEEEKKKQAARDLKIRVEKQVRLMKSSLQNKKN